ERDARALQRPLRLLLLLDDLRPTGRSGQAVAGRPKCQRRSAGDRPAPDCLTSSVACAGVCPSVRSVCAGTDARAPFASAFSRTDWTDGQMLALCPVVSCVCADGASVSTSVRTFDDRTDATDWRGVPRLLLPCLVLLGGLAGGGIVGGGRVVFWGGTSFSATSD